MPQCLATMLDAFWTTDVMPHETTLIVTIAASLGLALALGFIAVRLHLPVLVGYIVAGIIVGPHTSGFVANMALSNQLAEIGVILLMFGVGLHFSLSDLFAVRRIALTGALATITLSTALGGGLAWLWGWNIGGALVFGLCLSVASTVVLIRAMEQIGQMGAMTGHIAVGWLVVEDLVMVLVLVLLPPLAGWMGGVSPKATDHTLLMTLSLTLLKVAVFIVLMLVIGKRLFPWALWQVARTGSRELFTLCVVATAIGVAWGATALFGVSLALGAFFAGVMMRESSLSHRAAQESLPLRDAFSVLFFVSVGMLFQLDILLQEPLAILAVLLIIILGKAVIAFSLMKILHYPISAALTVAMGLAQIGEFSFILAGLGVTLGLLPDEGLNLILAGALLSIALNPLLFHLTAPLQKWLDTRFGTAHAATDDPLAILPMSFSSEALTNHVVLVGYGRVGRRIAAILHERGIAYVVVEKNRTVVEGLREQGQAAVAGEGDDADVLIQAHIARAALLAIAIPESTRACRMLEVARMLNPNIPSVARTHSEEEAELLRGERVESVFFGEQQLANSMAEAIKKYRQNFIDQRNV